MNRVLLVLAICLALSAIKSFGDTAEFEEIHGNGIYQLADHDKAGIRSEVIQREFETYGMKRVAERTDQALDGIFMIAVKNLRRRGHYSTANQIERGWSYHRGTLTRFTDETGRPIGDFAPLSQWLADAYNKIEAALGYELCRVLRLSDIKTLNYTIPVVFKPCGFGLEEFQYHFIHDDRYRGLAPVVAYWVTSITCSVATFGAGYFFICSPISLLVEMAFDRYIAVYLAPKIFEAACSK